jgi:hypothetical protein
MGKPQHQESARVELVIALTIDAERDAIRVMRIAIDLDDDLFTLGQQVDKIRSTM